MARRPSADQGNLFGADEPRRDEPRAPARAVRGFGPEGKIRIGTSGYSFVDWVGTFYPEGTPRGKMLDEYVRHFDVVEINSSHYRIPTADMFARMESKTPPGFEFMVKLFQGMTHKA